MVNVQSCFKKNHFDTDGNIGKRKGRKQHSEIDTSTPMTEALEMKKTIKANKIEKRKAKEKRNGGTVLKKEINSEIEKKTTGGKPSYRRKILSSSSSVDESLVLVESDNNENIFHSKNKLVF